MITPLTKISALPSQSGIYYVRDSQGTIIYIGKSKNIKGRWEGGHHKLDEILEYLNGTYATIETHYISEIYLINIESLAIEQHDPILNKQKPKKVGASIK